MKEYASNLREVKQELLKDHEGLVADGESVRPDEDDDNDAHETDEEHRHEPGGDDWDEPKARVLHLYDSNGLLT